MPAAITPSPASRYGGVTWSQMTLEDSLVGTWSLSPPIFSRELLGLALIPGARSSSLCSLDPQCCQLKDPDTVCLCQPALPWSNRDISHISWSLMTTVTHTAQLCTDPYDCYFKTILKLYLLGWLNPDLSLPPTAGSMTKTCVIEELESSKTRHNLPAINILSAPPTISLLLQVKGSAERVGVVHVGVCSAALFFIFL